MLQLPILFNWVSTRFPCLSFHLGDIVQLLTFFAFKQLLFLFHALSIDSFFCVIPFRLSRKRKVLSHFRIFQGNSLGLCELMECMFLQLLSLFVSEFQCFSCFCAGQTPSTWQICNKSILRYTKTWLACRYVHVQNMLPTLLDLANRESIPHLCAGQNARGTGRVFGSGSFYNSISWSTMHYVWYQPILLPIMLLCVSSKRPRIHACSLRPPQD